MFLSIQMISCDYDALSRLVSWKSAQTNSHLILVTCPVTSRLQRPLNLRFNWTLFRPAVEASCVIEVSNFDTPITPTTHIVLLQFAKVNAVQEINLLSISPSFEWIQKILRTMFLIPTPQYYALFLIDLFRHLQKSNFLILFSQKKQKFAPGASWKCMGKYQILTQIFPAINLNEQFLNCESMWKIALCRHQIFH